MHPYNNITQKIGAQLAVRMKENAGARADMYLSDYVPVSASSAKIMIGHDGRFGTPDANHIVSFIAHKFGGELDVAIDTVTAHVSNDGRKSGVSVVVTPHRKTLPLDEKKYMVAVSSTMFMDQHLNANWEIKESADGTKFLECQRGEDIPQLLNTAIASQGPIAGAIRFNDQGVTASVEVHVGDFVEFFVEQGGLRRGDVVKVNGDKVSILAEDRQFTVDAPAIRKILVLNPKTLAQKENTLEAFFATYLGPEFAKKFVKG